MDAQTKKIVVAAAGVAAGLWLGRKLGKKAGAVAGAVAGGLLAPKVYNAVAGMAGLEGLDDGSTASAYEFCCQRLKNGEGLYEYCTDDVLGAGWRNTCLNPAPPPSDGGGGGGGWIQTPGANAQWPWWYLPEGVIMANGAVDPTRKKEGAKAGKIQESACLRDTWNQWNATWGTDYDIRDKRFKNKVKEFAKACIARHKNWKMTKKAEGVKVP